MHFGICNLSLIAVRKEPSDKAEMVTQLLFGEHFTIVDKHKQWKKIVIAYEEYEGWIDEKQYIPISDVSFQNLNSSYSPVSLDLVQVLVSGNLTLPIVLGSSLPFFYNNNCIIEKDSYVYEGNYKTFEEPSNKKSLLENAYMYLNTPYLWGGRSPFGIDCSGFTQMVYKICGIKLKRDAYQQAEQGYTLNLLEEAEPGDLIFFDNDEGKIIHVGIALSNNKIIHASGKVRIDKIDHHGIYNSDSNQYTHKTRLIKRLL